MKEITVAIVEDNEGIRSSLGILISGASGFILAGKYSDSESALEKLPLIKPDIILMDINLPGKSGIECVRLIKPILQKTEIIMLTMYDNSELVFEALKAGAAGYLLKRTPPSQLLEAIIEAYNGGSPMSMQIARMVVRSFANEDKIKKENELTAREQEVLELLSQGLKYKEIADKLFVSLDTIRTHIRKIYEKLQVKSKTQATLKYLKQS